jgi:signal transduction histidine kinase
VSAPVPEGSSLLADRELAEKLARTLRHEVGDFLQKVYASVAILQKRLASDLNLERDVLTRLRARAETCKQLLDAIQDFLCPLLLTREPTDLVQVAGAVADDARRRHPAVEFQADSTIQATILGDADRLTRVGEMLQMNAIEAGARRIAMAATVRPETGQVEWTVTDDGPGVPLELVERLFHPFFTTRAGHAGLGLALVQKVITLHGGQVHAGNLPQGGFRVRMLLPLQLPRV